MVKKVVDTWKLKQWYHIVAPQNFESKPLGDVVATEDKHLLNRIISVGLDELTGDFSQTYINVRFRIVAVNGKTAQTKFIGHEVLPSYLKTFIKRRKTLIDDVVDAKTADGQDVRVKLVVFAAGKVARDTEAAIRTAVRREVIAKVSELTLDQFLQELFFKKFSTKLIPPLKKLAPLRRVEIRKTEVAESFAK